MPPSAHALEDGGVVWQIIAVTTSTTKSVETFAPRRRRMRLVHLPVPDIAKAASRISSAPGHGSPSPRKQRAIYLIVLRAWTNESPMNATRMTPGGSPHPVAIGDPPALVRCLTQKSGDLSSGSRRGGGR